MSIITKEFVKSTFPPVKFAFYGNYINRYKGVQKKNKPIQDLILSVDNLKEFHKENLHMNKKHYQLFARMTHARIVNFF